MTGSPPRALIFGIQSRPWPMVANSLSGMPPAEPPECSPTPADLSRTVPVVAIELARPGAAEGGGVRGQPFGDSGRAAGGLEGREKAARELADLIAGQDNVVDDRAEEPRRGEDERRRHRQDD